MKLRPLGKTGLQVSALSLGGAAFGDMYGTLQQGEADACVRRALALGINLIDTSPFYGLTRSESVLGEILSQDGLRNQVILCSKAGRNDRASFDFSPGAMIGSVEASLTRLKTDRLDLLIAHDIEFADDFEKVFTETYEALLKLKQQGKTRFIGMSCLPLGLLVEAVKRCALDVVISYTHYTLQNQRLLNELLPTTEALGVGVMNASPLCMGLLSDHGQPEWHPAGAALRQAAKQAAELCHQRGISLTAVGMQFACAEDRIATTISGAAKASEIEANVKAMNSPLDLTLFKEIQTLLKPVMNQTWPSGNWHQ